MTLNNYKLVTISKLVDGKFEGDKAASINRISIDSRTRFAGEGTLFIALKGENRDGHNFIKDAFDKGVRNFLVEKSFSSSLKSANFIVVNDTLVALQLWAQQHRLKFNIPIVAITGSNGKTVVKEWLYHFLKSKFNISRSPKSYNSQIGVPLSILMINESHQLALIEAGISEPGEMKNLHQLIQPTHSILTSIGNSHLENFSDKNELLKEKLVLFEKSKNYLAPKTEIDTNSLDEKFEAGIENLNSSKFEDFQRIDYSWKGSGHSLTIPFKDSSSVQNIGTCINFLLDFDYTPNELSELSKDVPSIALRLEKRKGINNSIIIDDTYNSDIKSVEIAVDYLFGEKQGRDTIVVLSDITLDNSSEQEAYSKISSLINHLRSNVFIGIGSAIKKYASFFENGFFFNTTEEFIKALKEFDFNHKAILLKGARKFKFEKIAAELEEKTHETVLTIDFKKLNENLSFFQKLTPKKTKLLCMIKAAGYGSGIIEIGKKLSKCNVDFLGVAYSDEGLELRKNNIDLPILIMNAEKKSFSSIVKNNLTPSIYSFEQLDEFIRTLIDHSIFGYPIHLKFDTGMNRLGFKENEINALCSLIANQPEIRVEGIFSHLASSDNPDDDHFSDVQFSLFEKISDQIEKNIGYKTIKHMLNSSGIERFPKKSYDMVRLGLGLYGISSNKSVSPIVSLTTKICQIKTVNKGEAIGYGRNSKANKNTLIGIIPIGYADGFSRAFSNGKGTVIVSGKKASVIGNVCMDMTMIDLNGINAKVGDAVEIFGPKQSIDHLASSIDTIPYEILTSISERVTRIYKE